MSAQDRFPWHATHITSVEDLPAALTTLSALLHAAPLKVMAQRWQSLDDRCLPPWTIARPLPGLIGWGKRPDGPVSTLLYLIWKDPWMAAARNTYIGSLCGKLGLKLPAFETLYPIIDLAAYDPMTTLLLLSSEPYPFHKRDAPGALDGPHVFPHAFVDGESFAWFGARGLDFLEKELQSC